MFTENGKIKGKLLPKTEEISGGKAYTNTQKLILKYFDNHRCFSQSEEQTVKMGRETHVMQSSPFVHMHLLSSD